jgi:hypothetical protein
MKGYGISPVTDVLHAPAAAAKVANTADAPI